MDDPRLVRERCKWEYINDSPTTTTVLCTLLIVVFTVALELAAHSYMNCCNTIKDEDVYNALGKTPDEEELLPRVIAEQPQPEPAPQANVQQNDSPETDAAEAPAEPTEKKPPSGPDCFTCCVPNPSPNIRANRLITAVFMYAVILTAFSIRIDNINNTWISPECRRFFTSYDVPAPNWWAVSLLNILPLVIATLSVLRTIVDCFLVRWGRGLKYVGQDGADNWTTWPMCMSFFLVFVCIREVARLPITLLMGMPRGSAGAGRNRRTHLGEDEMGGDEMRGLAEGVDDDSEYEGDGGEPPAYNDAIHGQQGVQTGSGKGR